MELEYSFCAKYGEVGADGFFAIIGGGLDRINGPQLPVVIPSMAVVMRISVSPEEFQTDHRLRVELFDSCEQRLPLEVEFPVPHTSPIPGEAEREATFSCAICMSNLTFPVAGDYEFRISVDEQLLGITPLYIRLLAAQQEATT